MSQPTAINLAKTTMTYANTFKINVGDELLPKILILKELLWNLLFLWYCYIMYLVTKAYVICLIPKHLTLNQTHSKNIYVFPS